MGYIKLYVFFAFVTDALDIFFEHDSKLCVLVSWAVCTTVGKCCLAVYNRVTDCRKHLYFHEKRRCTEEASGDKLCRRRVPEIKKVLVLKHNSFKKHTQDTVHSSRLLDFFHPHQSEFVFLWTKASPDLTATMLVPTFNMKTLVTLKNPIPSRATSLFLSWKCNLRTWKQ